MPMTHTDTDETVRRNISETADPIRLKAQVKRGTDTRDQDVIEVKVKGDDPGAAVSDLNDTLALLRDTAEDVRAMQPGEDGE